MTTYKLCGGKSAAGRRCDRCGAYVLTSDGVCHAVVPVHLEARWVSVDDELPPPELVTLLWGSALTVGEDLPCAGRLCGCHGQWCLETFLEHDDRELHAGDDGSTDPVAAEYTRRMLGEVTHWLDWRPGPREEGGDG